MVKGSNEKLEGSNKSKSEIIERGIEKKNDKGKKLGNVGVEACSPAADSGSNDEFAGYIFLCNGKTKPECFTYRVFGLPSQKLNIVAKIKPESKLFLFDFDVKLLYGVYSATCTGTMHLEPLAFGGRFPAQVRFEIFKECVPMPESKFKHVIKDNYQGGSKFRQNLSANQVDNLISLFSPLPLPPPSESHTSLFSKESQSRKILLQEIEKQSRSPDISTLTEQAPGSQYIASRFADASIKAQLLSLPLYDSSRSLSSTDWAHERTSVKSQLYPSSKILPHDNLYHPELLRRSSVAEYSASNPGLHGLASRYMNGPLLSRMDVNHHMQLPNDYYIYQNENIGQGYIKQQIPQQIAAPPVGSGRIPASVLAAAYWVAVAKEIPQPSVHQTSDSEHSKTGQDNSSTLVQHKPSNLASQSILDAYWEAKKLEDSRQAHPGSSHLLPHSGQQPISQGSVYPASHAYYGDQSQFQHLNQHSVLVSSQEGTEGVYPTGADNGSENQASTSTSGLQQQVVYDPAGIQKQHSAGLQQQVVYDPVGSQMQHGAGLQQQQVAYDPAGSQMQHCAGLQQQQVVYDPAGTQMQHGPGHQQQVVYNPPGTQMQHGAGLQQQQVVYDPAGTQMQHGPGHQQQVVYDPSGTQMQHGAGHHQQVVYDPSGTQMQHGAGHQQQQAAYDPAGIQMQHAAGLQQQQVLYDPSGTQMQHGAGHQQQQAAYDPAGVQMQHAAGLQQQQVVYDPAGIQMQHGAGLQQQQVMYDPAGIQMHYGAGLQQQQVVYDPAGIQMQQGAGLQQQQVVYDPAGIQMQHGAVPAYYPTYTL